MNTKKTIFAMITSIALLLATLCGCTGINDNEINSVKSNDREIGKVEIAETEDYGIGLIEPLVITMSNDTNIKDEVIKHIEISKTIEKINQDYWLYDDYKISDIKEFYSFDNFIIDGYQLYVVSIFESLFGFRFVPIDNWKNEDFIEHNEADIRMGIYRPEWVGVDKSDPLKSSVEQAKEQGWGYLTEDDMLYSPKHAEIQARIGNTLLYIRVPQELNSYEFLRDLAFKVIETAELVVVGE